MESTPKALYNSLRMRSLEDPSLAIESWKVEDLRKVSLDTLFLRLAEKHVLLDKARFIAFANEYDSPEELSDALVHEEQEEDADAIYLLVFELWRRLVPEKQTISLIADELDYQIFLYDLEALESLETLDDAIASLYGVLEENIDQGVDPKEAFDAIQEFCAHDILRFLYDYIATLIESKELSFASELLEQFYPFIRETIWFDFLHAQLVAYEDPIAGHAAMKKIVAETKDSPDVLLNLDILEYLSRVDARALFRDIAQETLECIQDDDDLQELLFVLSDFFKQHGFDHAYALAEEAEQLVSQEGKKKKLFEALSACV